jgi:hypothetical protein
MSQPWTSAKLYSLIDRANCEGTKDMLVVGVLARFDVKPGSDAEFKQFFDHGRAFVEGQPPSTTWFAFRIDQTTYGALPHSRASRTEQLCCQRADRWHRKRMPTYSLDHRRLRWGNSWR